MNFKKVFCTFFTAITGLVLMSTFTKVDASAASWTPWTLSFDNAQVHHVSSLSSGSSYRSNGFSITYNDPTGKSQGGVFDIWRPNYKGEDFSSLVSGQYIANGETLTYQLGGRLRLNAYHVEYGVQIEDAYLYGFHVDRSIVNSNRIETNLEEGKYYYNKDIYFSDVDCYIEDPEDDLFFEVKNLTSGVTNYLPFAVITENGKYEVTIKDLKNQESRIYRFAIDKTAPIIYLTEHDYLDRNPKLSGAITSKGMEVIYGDNIQINSMRYEYRPFRGRIEYGTMPSGQIFWRKGHYTITVSDMVGNTSVSTFTITDYDLLVDPETAGTVGTEVTVNKGEYGDPTMHVGFNRCLYIGPTGPSQSRFDFNFTSSDESIATVSPYGTVIAHGAGTVLIKCISKDKGYVGMIVITVLLK